MTERQARIFVPNTEPQDGWAETLLGRVVLPLVQQHESELEWFWFSHYQVPEGIDDGDCEISKLPQGFRQDVGQHKNVHRSIRFRFCVASESTTNFENDLTNVVAKNGYCIPGGPIPWILKTGLGDDRHVGIEHRNEARREQRAKLVVSHYMSISRLMLDSLIGPDANGLFRLEKNDHQLNPHGSTFESLHHLFCNITAVPTFAQVAVNGQQVVEIPVKF